MQQTHARLLTLGFIVALAACAPKIENRGNLIDHEKLAQIKPGESTREDVVNKIGSPTQIATFDENTWYYFGRSTKQYSFLDPEVIEQNALEIKFNDQGIVTAMATLNPDEAQDIDPVGRSTPTYGHDMTFIEQLVGNMGSRAGGLGSKDKKK